MTKIHNGFICTFAMFCYQVAAIEKVDCKTKAGDDFVILQSQELECFKVPVKVAKESETLKNLIEDAGTEAPIPLPNRRAQEIKTIFTIMGDAKIQGIAFDLKKPAMGALLPNDLNDLAELIRASNYLDIKDLLNSSAEKYAQQIFGNDLEKIADFNDAKFAELERKHLSVFPKDIRNMVVSYAMQSFRYIDRIFPGGQIDEAHREGRRAEAGRVPLQVAQKVAQIVSYVAKNNIASIDKLPAADQKALADLKYADKILFGPVNFNIWPNSCPLPGLPDYSADADDKPDARYVDNKDGTVTDVCTRLIWEKTPAEGLFKWEPAKKHCAGLVKVKSKDWHLPTITELASLIDKTKTRPGPFWNQVFGASADRYWSSSPRVGSPGSAWDVYFLNGYVLGNRVFYGYRARCVR